jgi:DNA-directed RNA polymerase specialized sigma24 family protein
VLQRVRSLLGPDEARAVDLMLENRSWKEIGDVMGIEPDAARMKVRRALDRVRDRMGIAAID